MNSKVKQLIILCSIGALALLAGHLSRPAEAVTQHGISVVKGCDTPKGVGQTIDCQITVRNQDTAGDDILLTSAFDCIGGTVSGATCSGGTRDPASGSLTVFSAFTNTTINSTGTPPACVTGGSLPCLIGATGVINFVSTTYVIQAADGPVLSDNAAVNWLDQCNSLTTSGCPTTGQVSTAGGSTTVVNANISLSPATATNSVGSPHTVTCHINVDPGTGSTNAPAGTTCNVSIVSGPGTLSAASCITVGATGSCDLVLNSNVTGTTTLHGATDVTVAGIILHRETDGSAVFGNGADVTKLWVNANIALSPATATNSIGSPHTVTCHINVDPGSGVVNAAAGTTCNVSIVSGPGNLSAASCLTLGTTGSCTVTLNSNVTGTTTLHATTDVTVAGLSLHRETDGSAVFGNGSDVTKLWVNANIALTPATATNSIGSPHTVTCHINVDPGTGVVNAAAGTTCNVSIVSGPGNLSAASCLTVGTTGSCDVTLNSNVTGTTTLHGTTDVTVAGLSLHRETDGSAVFGNGSDVTKLWVNANIALTPATATNPLGSPHDITCHINVDPGTGVVNAPAGTTCNVSIVSGPGSLSAASCLTIGTTGSCTVTLNNSTTTGTTVLHGTTDVTVAGLSLHRETDGNVTFGNGSDVNKIWQGPNPGVVKTTPSAAITAGGNAVFTIVVTAGGSGDSLNVVLTDNVPAGTIVGGADAGSCAIAAGVLTCNFGTIANGTSRTITVTIPTTTSNCPTLPNTATITATSDVDTSNNQSTATANVNCPSLATRTPGFWQTHTAFTTATFQTIRFGPACGSGTATAPVLTIVPGATTGGCIDLGFTVINSPAKLFELFYESPGGHSAICGARISGSFQFLAALLNSAGSQLGYGTATLTAQQMTDMYLALKNGPRSAILSLAGQFDQFNNSGDSIAFSAGTNQGNATPQTSQTLAGTAPKLATNC